MTPTKFGRYEIRSELAHGGMGIVYHAHDPVMDREVAIKVLPAKLMHDPKLRKRFEREARVVADLEHPALVPIYDIGEENEQLYLVMRYLSGGTLLDRLKKRPQPIDEMARIVQQLAPAFDYVHQEGVIHRDVKPGNIVFDRNDNAFLTDFGVVKLTAATTPLTTGTVLGTPHYMAPELAQEGGTVTHLVDIYALGVTVYQALTGELPYSGPGSSPVTVLMAHINEPTPDVRILRPDLSEAVSEVIEKAMAKKLEERYQAVGELATALTAASKAPPSDSQPLIPLSRESKVSPEPPPAVLPTRIEKALPAAGPDMPTQPASLRPPPVDDQEADSNLLQWIIVLIIAMILVMVAAIALRPLPPPF
jgi:serine/threonine protein kinase